MALGRSVFVVMVLTLYGTVISQPVPENKPFYENDVTLSSIEEIVERYNFQVMDKLLGEMRKGFQNLRRELKLERTRRQDLEEKIEKCFAGIHVGNVKSTTNPTWNVKNTTNHTRIVKNTTNPTLTTSTMLPITATIPMNETIECSDGFSEYEGHCYMFETKKLNWSEASQACQDDGAYLVSVNTQDEQDFLVKQIKSNYTTGEWDYFWLGLTLVAGKEVWADGTDVSYTQWADYNPDCMKSYGCKAYISEYSDFGWEDANNGYKFFSVCEQEKTQNGDERTAQTAIPSVAMSTVRPCPPKSVRFEGHCYLFEMKKMNWSQAERSCRRRGAYLVSVNTQGEQEFLVTHIKNHGSNRYFDNYWLGMSVKADKEVWADGTIVNYTHWGDIYPHCMERESFGCKAYISESSDFCWGDAFGDHMFFSVCELETTQLGDGETSQTTIPMMVSSITTP